MQRGAVARRAINPLHQEEKHGLGADGNDFAGLIPELDLSDCPPIRFVFPHAPSIAVTINGGYVMPAWYDILGVNLVDRQDAVGIEKSARSIEALIAHEVERGIPHQRIVLAGFSQGCAMALHTGLRQPKQLAGIVALSGYLPLAGRFAAERHAANATTPIFMAHGSQDPVVVIARGENSRNALAALGYPVQWHAYPMQHSVHPRELQDNTAQSLYQWGFQGVPTTSDQANCKTSMPYFCSWGSPLGRMGSAAAETETSNAVRAVAGRPAGRAGERARRRGAERADGRLGQAQRAGRAMAHGAAGVRATDPCGRCAPQQAIRSTGAGWRAGCRSQVCITPITRGAQRPNRCQRRERATAAGSGA